MPPVAVRLTLPQPVVEPVMPAVGAEFTVTLANVEAVQPLALVTVTVYVPLLVKVTFAEFIPFDQAYSTPPVAVKLTLPQPVVAPVMPAMGEVLTTTLVLLEAVQPAPLVAVTI